MQDGTLDDKANSNNGDMVRVLATTVEILLDFTAMYPNSRIFFAGSTEDRNRLYGRILKTYHSIFSKQFIINAVIEERGSFTLVAFDPGTNLKYSGFLIERIH